MNDQPPVPTPDTTDSGLPQPVVAQAPNIAVDKWQTASSTPPPPPPSVPTETVSSQSVISPQPQQQLTPDIQARYEDPVPTGDNASGSVVSARTIPWRMIAIVVVVVGLLVGGGLGVTWWLRSTQDAAARQAREEKAKQEAAKRADLPTFPLSTDVTTESLAKWQAGNVLDGWALSTDSPTTITHTNAATGATFSLYITPTTASVTGITDRTRSENFMALSAAEAKASAPTNMGTIKVKSNDSKTIEFHVAQMNVKPTPDKTLVRRLAVRATAGYIYVVEYGAMEADWSAGIWNSLTKDIVLKGKFTS